MSHGPGAGSGFLGRLPAALSVLSLLGACASYEPPQPGVHRAPGERASEAVCGYETPTASRFMQMRCRSAEDINRGASEARESADSIRTPAPQDIR